MKILMLSIFAPHFFNWTEQLRDSGHEIYWLDVYDSNTKVEKIDFVKQITGWRYKWDHPGRYFLKSKAPGLTRLLNRVNERKLEYIFEEKLREIQPDVVHSFVMFIAGYPVLKVMKKNPQVKWVYSSWGSDMYFQLNSENHLKQAEEVLPKIDYLFTDCDRDHEIAKKHGFKGEFLGTLPGGGGFDLEKIEKYKKPLNERTVILIKGYQGELGRCIQVLQALEGLQRSLERYQIVIFGATPEVRSYVSNSQLKKWQNLKLYAKISRQRVLELMGESLIYIGNSVSDGIPNTLLEAIISGTFPIQSNPGGASAEVIKDGFNGLLINDEENVPEIRRLLKKSVSEEIDIFKGISYNLNQITPRLERAFIREKVLEKYRFIENQVTQT
jgi:glycosyltransferase involved in cell wall biosynthesis